LDNFYIKINFNPEYRKYPVFIYHGYYQRRVGCLSAANRSLYIDSAGFINACPFCHTKNYDARGLLDGTLRVKDIAMEGCPNRIYVWDKGNNPRAVNFPADSGVLVESL
jgi:hypothetical protein